jgi:hypothetical protein
METMLAAVRQGMAAMGSAVVIADEGGYTTSSILLYH